jgi:hypothetical protein
VCGVKIPAAALGWLETASAALGWVDKANMAMGDNSPVGSLRYTLHQAPLKTIPPAAHIKEGSFMSVVPVASSTVTPMEYQVIGLS